MASIIRSLFFLLFVPLLLFSCSLFTKSTEQLNNEADFFISRGKVDQAIPLVKKSAKRGNAEAQYNLGYCYEKGVGVKVNQDQAIRWYQKSADQQYMDAEYAMMSAYAEGKGVEKNNEKAFEYALKCAEKKDPTCIFNVVGSYQDGRGVEKDTDKMLEWAFKLAKLPSPKNKYQSGKITSSRLQIAELYAKGELIDQDFYQAYLWYLIYNENKSDLAFLQQEKVISRIKEIEEKLTEKELNSAPSDAEKLIHRPLNNLSLLYRAEDMRTP